MNTRTNTSADEGGSTDFVSGGGRGGGASFPRSVFALFPFSYALRARFFAVCSTQQQPLFRHRMSSLLPARYSLTVLAVEDVDIRRDAVESGIGSRPIAIIGDVVCGRSKINNEG